ncbi:uncharacterized protein LOC110191192 isoform X1 [Drosophila serrata]|uniref:uncharacterized protein LOC110191192 isoform X1 n=1 Tax=Drosophila serrata TaxID=7274 RepID=UPI000A1D0DE8|nr:uncharacterized protein LOC110191192 isoform X1 [Drosophila serrata]
MLASVSVRDLVKLYENLIANASNDAQGKPLRMLEQKAAKLRSLSDVSMHNLDLDQSASGEPHRVVLKVIDLPIMDYEVPDMLEESANKTFQPEPQSVEARPKKLRLHEASVSEDNPSLKASKPATELSGSEIKQEAFLSFSIQFEYSWTPSRIHCLLAHRCTFGLNQKKSIFKKQQIVG